MTTPRTIPDADFDTTISPPAPPLPEWDGETIAGFRIHPFASRFPLLTGQPFEELVASIQDMGIEVPVELSEGLVTDGRNRLHAVDVLRARGVDVELRTVEWKPQDGRSVEEHIFARNVLRRHLTDDQRAALSTMLLPAIRAAMAAKQATTRFGGAARTAVTGNSQSPQEQDTVRSGREKVAATSIGQLALVAKISPYKAAQAAALEDAVRAGAVPPEELRAVCRGEKLLREVSPSKKKPARPHSAPRSRTAPEAETIFDAPDTEAIDEPDVTEDEIRRRWCRFKEPFAITDHRELRKILSKIIAEEQDAFDRR